MLPLKEVLGDNHYPLSYTLVHFALKLGDTESLLRMPSYLAGILNVWLIFLAGRALYGRATGFTAALLATFSSALILYSQDGRFYSIMPCMATLAIWASVQILKHPRRWDYWIWYGFALALGTLNHPFFLPFTGSLFLGVALGLWLDKSSERRRKDGLAKLVFFTAAGLAPVIAIYASHQFRAVGLLRTDMPEARSYLLRIGEYYGFLKKLLHFQAPEFGVWGLLLGAAGAVLIAVQKTRLSLPLFAVAAIMPFPFFLKSVTHWYTEKYFIAQLPVWLIFVSVFVVQLSRFVAYHLAKRRQALSPGFQKTVRSGVVPVIVLALILEVLVAQYFGKDIYKPHWNTGWRIYAEYMSRYMTGKDVIVHFAPLHLNPYAKGEVSFEPSPTSLDFYLKRQVPSGRRDLYPTTHLETVDVRQLDSWLQQYRTNNVWLIHYNTTPMVKTTPAQDRVFSQPGYGFGSTIRLAAAPTENLILNGGLNAERGGSLQASGNVFFANHTDDVTSGTYAVLSASPDTTASLSLNIKGSFTGAGTTDTLTLVDKTDYILSFRAKPAGLKDTPGRDYSMDVGLVGKSLTEGAVWVGEVSTSSADWEFFSFPVTKDHIGAIGNATALRVVFTLGSGNGIVSIDDVQLEAGMTPTLFTDTIRKPHDEALRSLGI